MNIAELLQKQNPTKRERRRIKRQRLALRFSSILAHKPTPAGMVGPAGVKWRASMGAWQRIVGEARVEGTVRRAHPKLTKNERKAKSAAKRQAKKHGEDFERFRAIVLGGESVGP